MLGLRLPKDWKSKKIGEIAEEVSLRNTSNEVLPVLSCTKYDGLVDSLKYFKRKVFSDDVSKYKLVPRNHFAYATNHIEEGSIGYQEIYANALISPIYTVFKTSKDVYDPFLFYLFKTELYRHIFEINTSASVDRRGSLRWKQFSHIAIPLPAMEEQKKIAKIISAWDRAIETLDKLIDAKTKLKKGLMQKLLNSKGKLVRLRGIAEIRFSSVDKKSYPGQRQVLLCNYLDVYNNTYITNKLPFMKATATEAEIEKFGLQEGDVIITKDSETPDDIGVPAVVVEKMQGVVCGYHLAIIRPDTSKLNSIYLVNELKTLRIKKQFYKFANGATRFGLGGDDIGKIDLHIPKLSDQKSIAQLFQSLDRELSLFAMLKRCLQLQKQGLMQKLLTGKMRVKIEGG